VDRLACVSVPSFPLQILLRRHPEWGDYPAAVVEEDRPQSPVTWVSDAARRAGILPGMRYATALSLAPALRAGAVSPAQVAQERDRLIERLRRFTPDVEPSMEEPGVFWLSLSGLEHLYPSPARWAEAVHMDLREAGSHAIVVVGFTRFDTYAVARAWRAISRAPCATRVFDDPAEARAAAMDAPLARLAIGPQVRDALSRLGVATVGALLRLPDAGLLERFGTHAHRLHRAAAGSLWTPLRPWAARDPVRRHLVLDAPETDTARCVFVLKHLLDSMLAALAARGEALAVLGLRIRPERCAWQDMEIRPAAPTLDPVQVLELVRLRLEALQLPAGIVEVDLAARSAPATHEQVRFFAEHPQRDLATGNRALARLRVELGEDAVVRAQLRDGHLPEARVFWEPVTSLRLPRPAPAAVRTMVRRIFARPVPLPPAPRHLRDDGWLILGTTYGALEELIGPYVLSGGWWIREVTRAYHFAQTRNGSLLWVFYDGHRRRWFLHGRVE
jgi:protein ImuB